MAYLSQRSKNNLSASASIGDSVFTVTMVQNKYKLHSSGGLQAEYPLMLVHYKCEKRTLAIFSLFRYSSLFYV